jgi:hypothetical protein
MLELARLLADMQRFQDLGELRAGSASGEVTEQVPGTTDRTPDPVLETANGVAPRPEALRRPTG